MDEKEKEKEKKKIIKEDKLILSRRLKERCLK